MPLNRRNIRTPDHRSCRRCAPGFASCRCQPARGRCGRQFRKIRFIARIMRGVEAPVTVELPVFPGYPRQHPAFDCAEVGADQHVTGCRKIIEREQSPTTESGRGYSLRTCS